jgi:ATP-dependent DNA helicase Rep
LELELQGLQIPYQLSGGTSFFARAEIKDVMAYLRLLVNPDDDSAFLRIINTPRREIGPSTLEKLGQYASQRQISLLSASQELGLQQFLTGKPLARLNQFCGWLSGIKQACQTMDGIAIVRQLLSDIDYEDWLQQVSPNPKAAQKRWENVHYLLDNMAKLISEQAGDEESLQAAVSRLVLRDMLEQQADNQNGNQVQLLTLHAAKGLEFPHVYLMGMEEELLPHRTSIEEEFIEEERRLAYVGITRAQRTLTFTYAKKRKQYGEYHETTPSRFLAELPADDLSWHGHQQVSSEAAQASGKQHLAQLKALLAAD